VLSDVIMPGSSGPELARRLLADRPGVKVLFMSGYAEGVPGGDPLLASATSLIEKPVSEAALGARVAQLFGAE
jgi:CheY-like chemotaxis protein